MPEPTEKVKIFISSVQNKEIEDLSSERSEVIKTVKDYLPTTPWAFEHTPASDLPAEDYYLRGVNDCHLFILILGGKVTDAVKKEYYEAVSLKRPVFAFVKDVSRSSEAKRLLDVVQKQSKYAIFKDANDIGEIVKASFDDFYHRLVEDYQLQKEYPEVMRVLADGELAGQLREYARQLLDQARVSFEKEVTHYLALVPASLRNISKFYIPMKANLQFGASETMDAILAKHKRVVVLGAAGSGKTTELLNLTARLSKLAIEETGTKQLPIYVNMRNWGQNDVFSQIESVFSEYGLRLERSRIKAILENYSVVFLFDGLDEVPPHELPEKINQIKSIARTYKNVEIIVTCRTTAHIADLDFPIAYLEPLQDADIIKYIAEFSGREFNTGSFYSWPAPLRELSKHPLILSFIANILAEGSKPTSLADVYMKYFDFQFTRWEKARGARIDAIWKKRALTKLAVYMQTESNYSISEDETIGQLHDVISSERVDFSSVDLLNELVSSGVIKKEASGYTFWHASFREYFASQLIIERIRKHEGIIEFISNPSWEQVSIFASALFDDSSETSRFLLDVLDADFYLYTRCLSNALSNPTSTPALSDEDLSRLILSEILEVRSRVIERWFPAMCDILMPNVYFGKSSKPAIVGRFSSEGGAYISYGYSNEEKIGGKVRLLSEFPASTTMRSLLDTDILCNEAVRGLSLSEVGIAGAHKIAIEDIWRELEGLIRSMNLPEPPRLLYEHTQAEVRYLVREHILAITIPADISLIAAQINKLLHSYGAGQVMLGVGGENIHLNDLLLRLKLLAKNGYTVIGDPILPEYDRVPTGSNWVTQFYKDETLVKYVKLYFQNFLDGYSEMVRLNFGQLSQRLVFYQLLPVRTVAEIERPEPSKDRKASGSCDYYFEPLEKGRSNEVIVVLNQKVSEFPSPSSKNCYELMDHWLEKLKKYGRWTSSMHVSITRSVLTTFFNEPYTIRKAVYDRMRKDLTEIFELTSFRIS